MSNMALIETKIFSVSLAKRETISKINETRIVNIYTNFLHKLKSQKDGAVIIRGAVIFAGNIVFLSRNNSLFIFFTSHHFVEPLVLSLWTSVDFAHGFRSQGGSIK